MIMISDHIIGKSAVIAELKQLAARVAKTEATVLITGESGVGKEVFARFIQQNSPRNDKTFVELNCAAIPTLLLESELFGHKKGAYTDAVTDSPGKVGYADGGTLFLDEIGDVDLTIQAKLLRFLQFKTYQPVGGHEELKSDIRIIAATNRKLPGLIEEGKFRKDLYYRLNVVNLDIPPLRKRKEDILLLADHFLRYYGEKYNKKCTGFDSSSKNLLTSYEWPGNVRELNNCIERAVVFSEDTVITGAGLQMNEAADSGDDEIVPLKEALYNFKRNYIIRCLEKNNWHQTETAKKLSIQRTYLARLIKELDINKL